MQRYEYDFVRLSGRWWGIGKQTADGYRRVVQERARDGWRLVQVLAPPISGYGSAPYYELIFEREVAARERHVPAPR